MNKYIKVFDTLEEYNNYSGSTGFVTPNISYVKGNDKSYYDNNEIKHYTPEAWIEVENETGTTLKKITEYIKAINIPSDVTSIGNSAFYFCNSLTSIDIPSGVISIGTQAFQNCSSLTSIDIPSGVTSLSQSVFAYCVSLTSIDIPSGVTSIGTNAFNGCIKLTSIIVNAINPPTLASNSLNNTNNCPIYVPASSVEAYKAATNWSAYANRIQAIPNN